MGTAIPGLGAAWPLAPGHDAADCRPGGPRAALRPTLAAWRQRLLEQRNAPCGLGFDEAFPQRWESYFAYCREAFRTCCVAGWQLEPVRKGGAHK